MYWYEGTIHSSQSCILPLSKNEQKVGIHPSNNKENDRTHSALGNYKEQSYQDPEPSVTQLTIKLSKQHLKLNVEIKGHRIT